MDENANKSQNILMTLREHLAVAFPSLSTYLPLSQIRNDTAGNISLVMPLKSRSEPTGASTRGYVNMGLPLDAPTFMLQFAPMAIISDEETPPPSSRTLLAVTVATYHGLILKKDYLTFFINFNNPNVPEEAELRASNCELLTKLDQFSAGFRLCAGLTSTSNLKINDVFIEPFGENRIDIVVTRSRNCEFMLEMEDMFQHSEREAGVDKLEAERSTCIQCGVLQNDAICFKTELTQNEIDNESDSEDFKANLEDIFEPEESDKTRNEDPNWSMAKSKPLTAADLSDSVTFYSCDHCEKKFKTERALQRHKDQIKKDAAVKFSCENCNRSFPNEVQLGSHIDGPQCKSLKKRRKKASILVKKPKKALKAAAALSKEMYQACPVCFRQFAMATRFDQHMELHKSRMENLYSETLCPEPDCDQSLPDRVQLTAHYMGQHEPDAAPCGYCLKVVNKVKMRAHFFAEHPYQQFECQICGKICPFQSQLRQHTKESHTIDRPKDVVCELCGNRYRREAGLRQHMASAHCDLRDYQCFHCGKGFTTHTRLTIHLRIHTGSKPFKCKLCEYKSNRADNVLFHCRKVHKIEKPSRAYDIHVFEEQLAHEVKPSPVKLMPEETTIAAEPLVTLVN